MRLIFISSWELAAGEISLPDWEAAPSSRPVWGVGCRGRGQCGKETWAPHQATASSAEPGESAEPRDGRGLRWGREAVLTWCPPLHTAPLPFSWSPRGVGSAAAPLLNTHPRIITCSAHDTIYKMPFFLVSFSIFILIVA